MPTKQYTNQRKLFDVLKELTKRSVVTLPSHSPSKDQRAFHKMLKRQGENVRVSKLGSELFFKRK